MKLEISPTEISVVCGTDLSTTITGLNVTYTNEFSHEVGINPRYCVYSPNIKEGYHISEDTDVLVSYGSGEDMCSVILKYIVQPNIVDQPVALVANDFVTSLSGDLRENIVAYIQYKSGKQELVPYTDLLIISDINQNMVNIPQKVQILEQKTQLKCELNMTIENTSQSDASTEPGASIILTVVKEGEKALFSKAGETVLPVYSDIKSDAGWKVYCIDEGGTFLLDSNTWTVTGVDTSKPGVYAATITAIYDGKLYSCYRNVTIMDMGGQIPGEDSGFVVVGIRDVYSEDKPFDPESDIRVYLNGVNIAPGAYTTIGYKEGVSGTISVIYTDGTGLEAPTYFASFEYTWAVPAEPAEPEEPEEPAEPEEPGEPAEPEEPEEPAEPEEPGNVEWN